MLDFDKKLCIGCTACATNCPKGAIEMIPSQEGFHVSSIDGDKCISCGRCDKVCPILNKTTTEYAVEEYNFCYSLSESDRLSAASGGVFGELAKATLEDGGLVCGCVWDEQFNARHIIADSMEGVSRMKGSKYVQSDLSDVFVIIKKEVKSRKVLFVGTPCQTTALSRIVGNSPNLTLCALVCGGSPSPLVWKQYLQKMEDPKQGEIIGVNHRCKNNGWLSLTIEIAYANGRKNHAPMALDSFARAFFCALSIGHFCEECTFKWGHFVADIVIADGWGASKQILQASRNKGVSSVAILSEKGMFMWNEIASKFQVYPCSKEQFYEHHKVIFQRKTPNPQRPAFFEDLNKMDIMENFKLHVKPRKHTFINNLLNKLGLYGRVYNAVAYFRAK